MTISANAETRTATSTRRPSAGHRAGTEAGAHVPVFAAESRWRERTVKAALCVAGILLLIWLVALIGGALGFGSLPLLPVPTVGGGGGSAPAPSVSQEPGARATRPHTAAAASGSATARRGGEGGRASTEPAAGGPSPRTEAHGGASGPAQTIAPGSARGPVPPPQAAAPAHGRSAGAGRNAAEGAGVTAVSETQAESPPHRAPTVTPSGHEVPSRGNPEPGSRAEVLVHGSAAAETGG
jgi:hypothetical protein